MKQAITTRAPLRPVIAACLLLPALPGIAAAQAAEHPARERSAAATPDAATGELASKVEAALRRSQGLDPQAITVGMDDGMVVLAGEVPNLLAHDRAIRIATSVKGVRAVDDNLIVTPAERADHEIERDIETAFALNPATEYWEINAIVSDGRVTLQGVVESFAEQTLAASVAKGVRGVREVTNQVQVDYGIQREDREIAHEVVQLLRWNTQVDSDSIEVDVENGIVKLSGTVDSLFAKEEAERLARVSGARRIDAQGLRVAIGGEGVESRWADPGDDDIAAGVRMALSLDPRIPAEDVKVSVKDGTVTLGGRVGDEQARRAAMEMARRTHGVEDVRNQLAVAPEKEVPDERLAQQVTAALERDPYVTEDEIDVESVDGRIYLYGEVDSYFEKYEAGDAASRIAGVRQVNNELDVPVLARTPDS